MGSKGPRLQRDSHRQDHGRHSQPYPTMVVPLLLRRLGSVLDTVFDTDAGTKETHMDST
jgi:hypothetical protein